MYIPRMVKYYTNGFLIIGDEKNHFSKNINYKGIEGGVWPLHLDVQNVEKDELQILIDYVDHNITSLVTSDYLKSDVTNDVDFINRCICSCKASGLNINILLYETEKSSPQIKISNENINKDFDFIGFDYGYCGQIIIHV